MPKTRKRAYYGERKLRIDSWAAALTEEQRWDLYDKARMLSASDGLAYAREHYGCKRGSVASWFRFLDFMRSGEAAHRLERAILAGDEARDLAEKAGKDEELAGAFKALATDIVMRTGDAATAAMYIGMAVRLLERAQKKEEIALKAAAQKTSEEAIALARERFEAAEARLRRVEEVAAGAGDADPAARLRRICEIFGLEPGGKAVAVAGQGV